MSVQLILIRHGIAEDAGQGTCDFDRKLSEEGVAMLERTIWRLRPFLHETEDTVILTSPRLRAVQTAQIVASQLPAAEMIKKVFVDDGCFRDLMEYLTNLAENKQHTVIVVGHQPTLGYWADAMCGRNLPFRKGAAASFTVQDRLGDHIDFDWFFQPDEMLSLEDRGSTDERIERGAIILSRQMKEVVTALAAYDRDPADAETVHRIRITSRKALAALILFRPILRDSAFCDAKRVLKQITKIFSGLRDIDVLLLAYKRFRDEKKEEAPAEIGSWIRRLRKEEEFAAMRKIESGRLQRRLESLSSKKMIVETFFRPNNRATMPFEPKVRWEKLFRRMEDALSKWDINDRDDAHAFRIMARHLRYMAEMTDENTGANSRVRGLTLAEIQDVFGRFCEAHRGVKLLESMALTQPPEQHSDEEAFKEYLISRANTALQEIHERFV